LKFVKNVKSEVVDQERFEVIIEESYKTSSAVKTPYKVKNCKVRASDRGVRTERKLGF